MNRAPTICNLPRLREMMERRKVDLIIIRNAENSKYISEFLHTGAVLGYRPFTVFLFRDPEIKSVLVVPAVDLHLAIDSTWIEDVRAYAMAEFFTDLGRPRYEDFFAAARDILAERHVRGMVIGTEGDDLSSGFRRMLEELLVGNTIVDVSFDMEIVRMVKTPEEIRRLRRATEITVKAHESFRGAIKPGNSDEDLNKAALGRMIAEGADGIRFVHIGCGPAHAYAAHQPHPYGDTIKVGDMVKVDMGATYRGYLADFVRTYFVGTATKEHQEIWKRLNEAQLELAAWMKPGMTGGQIFERGYSQISKYLPHFPREFIGHGLGMGSHEQPRMNRVNKTVLEPNTVFCIELSYYHEGIRHHTEDTFLITQNALEHWTKDCPRELVVPV
jgi:Xaa-Pro aminopeptidase